MVLFDREVQGVFQQGTGVAHSAKLQQQLAQENPRHHPVGFLRHTGFEVRHGFRAPTFGHERLGEAETKHLVRRLALDQDLKLFHPRWHASDRVDEHRHRGRVVRTTATDGKIHDVFDGRLRVGKLH